MPTPILHAVMHRRSARIAQLPNGLPVAFLERAEADGWAWDYRTREPFRVVALGEILSDEAAWLRVLGEDVLHVFERSAVSSSGYARAACGRYLVATIDRTPLDLSQRHMKCLACDELLPESARGPAPAWAEAGAAPPVNAAVGPDYELEALCSRRLLSAMMDPENREAEARAWEAWAKVRDENIVKGPLGSVIDENANAAVLEAARRERDRAASAAPGRDE